MKKRIIIGTLLLVLLGGFLWIRSHAFITITVNDNNQDGLIYTLTPENGPVTEVKTVNSTLKRLVKAGHYTVQITSQSSSYITNVKVGGFLTTTQANGRLSAENVREFVGNNPAPCMNYLSDRLYSYECGSTLNKTVTHLPATPTVPTYTLQNDTVNDDAIEGIVSVGVDSIFLSTPFSDGGGIAYHRLSKLDNSLAQTNITPLTGLDPTKPYKIVNSGAGFLVYSEDLTEALYFSSSEAKPEVITLSKPGKPNQLPIGLSTNGQKIVTSFSDDTGHDEAAGNASTGGVSSEIFVNDRHSSTMFTVPYKVVSAVPCASNTICVLGGDASLQVYAINGQRLTKAYAMQNVREVNQVANETLVVTDRGLVIMDFTTSSGHYVYTFGNYGYCGLQLSPDNYLVCLTDATHDKLALRVDTHLPTTTAYDKSLYKLRQSSGLTAVSVYKNIVFVTPDIQPRADGQSYDASELARGRLLVNAAVTAAGLPTDKFTIVNTTSPF